LSIAAGSRASAALSNAVATANSTPVSHCIVSDLRARPDRRERRPARHFPSNSAGFPAAALNLTTSSRISHY